MPHFSELVIFFGSFLIAAAGIHELSRRTKFPYTVALLMVGLIAQYLLHTFHLEVHATLSPDFIFFVLLPVLLFGAAMHINIHQFKLQFKTIAFAATFGLMTSVAVVTALLAYLINIPIGPALLFGTLISATDPIAVLALFKTLGAPQRLGLLADGESMFNDATAVIAFRAVSTVVVTGAHFGDEMLVHTLGEFLYVFLGSLVIGAIIGYGLSELLARVKNDVLVETTLALGGALLSFAATEHFFHLSGVISSVMAGLVVGNLGRSRFSANVIHFMHDFWEYMGYLAVSAVFFFATFTLDLGIFADRPHRWMFAILAILVGRAVSVYFTYALTNRLPFFRDEPNVPLAWQHILNWGGLRGVIPLVLVFTIPDNFPYKEDLFIFTFASLLFTLFVNGLSISWLLKKLKLHIPSKEEEIFHEEMAIFALEDAKAFLGSLPEEEFSSSRLRKARRQLSSQEIEHRNHLREIASEEELTQSLLLQAIKIQRDKTEELFRQGYITETVFLDFDAQLDLQQDALEHPQLFATRGITKSGHIKTRASFRRRLLRVRELSKYLPILNAIWRPSEERLIQNRFALLKVRLLTSEAVLEYFDKVARLFGSNRRRKKAIDIARQVHQEHIINNRIELAQLERKYPLIVSAYQERLLERLMEAHTEAGGGH